jgi:predicted MPP superfamily phosphohydrolase
MFLFVFLTLIGIIYGYVGWRLIAPLEVDYTLRLSAGLAVLGLGLLPPLTLLFRQHLQSKRWHDQFLWLTYLSMGFFVLAFVLVLSRDLVWLAWETAILIVHWVGESPEASAAIAEGQPTKVFHASSTNLAVIAVAVLTFAHGVYQARRRPRVVEINVPLPDLPEALVGFRIAQISDLHVGPTIKASFVRKIVETVQSTEPDLIAFTGDLADGSVARLAPQVQPLAQLRAKHGSYFVTGNHEYYSGVNDWLPVIEDLGFRPLINEHVLIERGDGRILLVGVTDEGAGEMAAAHTSDPTAAVSNAPAADLRILLAHQPKTAIAADGLGFDLQLSGHTHGGQLIPWQLFVKLQQPYLAGLYRRGSSWIYVNRGAGYWGPPLRVGAPAEIAILRLVRADNE